MPGSFFSNKAKRDALSRLTPQQRAEVARANAEKTLARTEQRAKKPPKDDDEKPKTYEIDILQHELQTGAPHWLHGSKGSVRDNLDPKRLQEIRDKHRNAAKGKPKK